MCCDRSTHMSLRICISLLMPFQTLSRGFSRRNRGREHNKSRASAQKMRTHDVEDWRPLLSNPRVEASVRRRGWAAYIRQLDDESNKHLLTGEEREFVNKVVHHASTSEHDMHEQLVLLVPAKLPHVRVNEMHERGSSSRLGLPGWLTFNCVFFGLIILSCTLGPPIQENERQDYMLPREQTGNRRYETRTGGLKATVQELERSKTTVHKLKGLEATVHELEVMKATVQELDHLKATVEELGGMKAVVLVEAGIIGALVCSCLYHWSGTRLTIPHWRSLWTSLVERLRVNGILS